MARRYAAHARRAAKRAWVWKYKSELGCKVCGEKDPVVLDFHHRNPLDKDPRVFTKKCGFSGTRSFLDLPEQDLIIEAQKCCVLCANCHRKLTWQEQHKGD